ncbi:hypothetical protein [Aliivibrio fischeri]|uniref:Cthe-2314-like HEPN domain-containing protein n=1 Tax=Aliivibrio fischeri SR5 TaxID=1088719 RepID=A0AAV3EMT2_ALIFS|nr:hypothetical protein [Aliivibrio fischeri]EHN67944.1 hypothetical protein VFSR5_2761 [Aliivibrio fischeri SR5]
MDSLDIFKSRLPCYCNLALQDLIYFKNFNNELDELWVKKSSQLDFEISSKLKNSEEGLHEDIVDFYQWDSTLIDIYPSIHRESLIISIFNLLEHHLNVLCLKFSEVFALNLKVNDLKDKGITRSFKYFSKVVGLSFKSVEKEKTFIANVNKLRNFIVHNGSIINQNNEVNFVRRNEFLSLTSSNRLIISNGFITEFINILESFWDGLDKLVLEYCQLKLA